MPLFLDGILIGLGATALMDLWTQGLGRLPGQSPPNWTLVGRWFCHLPQGRVFHPDITAADPSERDRATGWAAHYAVGIVYGIAFALLYGAGNGLVTIIRGTQPLVLFDPAAYGQIVHRAGGNAEFLRVEHHGSYRAILKQGHLGGADGRHLVIVARTADHGGALQW